MKKDYCNDVNLDEDLYGPSDWCQICIDAGVRETVLQWLQRHSIKSCDDESIDELKFAIECARKSIYIRSLGWNFVDHKKKVSGFRFFHILSS